MHSPGRTLFLFVFLYLIVQPNLQSLWAQPMNDSCAVAKAIYLPIEFGDPLTFQGHNIGATPEIPASNSGNCTPGGFFNGLGADVWYTFTPDRAMCVRVEVEGLLNPEFGVKEGNQCSQATRIACVPGSNGLASGEVTFRANQTYFLRVSGDVYTDQGYFDLRFTRVGCPSDDNCLISGYFTASPEPSILIRNDELIEYYNPGTTVNFCYSIDIWNDFQVNWIHAVQIDLGSAWDYGSLVPIPPFSCNGNGYWSWYESWVSCNSGGVFGPGFAYDAFNGLACGGTQFDGDPGNNWGDGPAECLPMEFCWSVSVKNCEQLEAQPQRDLDINITVLADSESGSYDIFGCDQEVDEEIELITLSCGEPEIESCFSQDPFIEVEPVSCFGEMDGSFTVDNVDTEALSNVLIYRLNDQLIEAFLDVELPFTIPNILDTGFYGVILETPGIGEEGFCEGILSTIIKVDGPFETFARVSEPAECLIDSVQLLGATWPNDLDGFSYLWSGPDGFFTTERNPVVTESGEYILTTIRNNCRVSDTINIVIGSGFALAADYLTEIPCLGDDLILTASGNVNVNQYRWVVPEGSDLTEPTFDSNSNSWNFGTISTAVSIQLVGIDTDVGCTDTVSFLAEVNEPPVLNWEAVVEDCPAAEVRVTIDQTDNIVEVLWLDNNSSDNPRVFSGLPIAQETTIPVQITNSNGCASEGLVSLIGPGVNVSADTPLLCPGEFATLGSSEAVSYLWSTGDTTATIMVAPEAGSSAVYSVSIIDAFGCEQVASTSIETLPLAAADFTFSAEGFDYHFLPNTANHPDLSYWWDFGDGTFSINYDPQHSYGIAGNYTVSLVTTGSCGTDTSTQQIELVQAPQAGFSSTATLGCAPFAVAFTSQSVNADQYQWHFPGGVPESSTEPNPEVTYQNPGTYPVTLSVSNVAGSDTLTVLDYLQVGGPPSASFGFVTDILSVSFTSQLENSDSVLWEFGDGNSSTTADPIHTYDLSGAYQVSLTAENECGTFTFSDSVIVSRPAPNVAFTTLEGRLGCAPLEINFVNQSENALSYEWSFPGGVPESSVETDPTVLYLTPGIYPVELTATNETGSNISVEETYIEVLGLPSVSFGYEAEELSVQFEGTIENADSYTWTFGDGYSSNALNPVHQYEIGGTYQVQLTAENECGPISVTETIVVSRPIPTVAFTTTDDRQGCAPLEVTFINQSNNALEYEWTFPGGTPGSSVEVNPTVVYSMPGIYIVQLNAINESGANSLVAESYIEILAPPSGSFSYSNEELNVVFEATAQNVNTYFWDFGDGNNSNLQSPTHTYNSNGTYEVLLRLENECDTIILTDSVSVMRALPTALFTSESDLSGCAPLAVSFINQSTDADSFRWMFEGGSPPSSEEANPMVVYDTPGLFPVELIAINETGEDQLIISGFVEVLGLPFALINVQLEGLEASFEADGEAVDSYFWNFGDGNTSQEQNPMHTYDQEGTYTVELTVSNECGSTTQNTMIEVVITNVEDPAATDDHWAIYPNPSDGQLNVRFTDWPYWSQHQVRLFNSLGQLIQSKSWPLSGGDQLIPIALDLPAGVYWLQLENEQGMKWPARKFVVQ